MHSSHNSLEQRLHPNSNTPLKMFQETKPYLQRFMHQLSATLFDKYYYDSDWLVQGLGCEECWLQKQ